MRSTDNDDVFAQDAYARDNELATLLFGISDLTLINMKGESKADIDNILQIVIHALLDIKHVNKNVQLKSRCLFLFFFERRFLLPLHMEFTRIDI